MSAATSRPLSLLRVDFRDLYERHLCRHSQFGINVAHLAALFGVWYGVYAFLFWLTRAEWVPVALAAAYLALVALNAPLRVVVATALFLAALVAAVLYLPALPWWADLLLVPVFYSICVLDLKIVRWGEHGAIEHKAVEHTARECTLEGAIQ